MKRVKNDDELRCAEALLLSATVDALRKTAILLVLIARGEVATHVAETAAQDLARLLEAVETAEHVVALARQQSSLPEVVH